MDIKAFLGFYVMWFTFCVRQTGWNVSVLMLTEPRERWHCFSIINLSSRFSTHPKRKNREKTDALRKRHIFVSKLACGNSKGMRGDSQSKLCLREEHRLLQSVWKGVNKMQKAELCSGRRAYSVWMNTHKHLKCRVPFSAGRKLC